MRMSRMILVAVVLLAAVSTGAEQLDGQPSGPAASTRTAAQMVACRTASAAETGAPAVPIRWVTPSARGDRTSLDTWCGAVGPVVVRRQLEAQPASAADELTIISWNVHVGGGDIDGIVGRLRSGALSNGRPVRHFVLLLQEAYRAGDVVPRQLFSASGIPGAIQPDTGARTREDITTIAARLRLNLYYAPSMRNGQPQRTDEDRGNAILSTLPLSNLTAIELPFERQRRVVVAATVHGRTDSGEPWQLTVASVHFDNLVGLRAAWIFSAARRQRQALGLVNALPAPAATVVGGDFNTWFGYRDPAYLEMATAFQDATTDRRPTFAGLLRLDHMFVRLPAAWQPSSRRLDNRFGSDHYPLMGTVRFADDPGPAPTR
jgi:endonuclease/exonuclease/phosphatase family metal-dependent hydrolase